MRRYLVINSLSGSCIGLTGGTVCCIINSIEITVSQIRVCSIFLFFQICQSITITVLVCSVNGRISPKNCHFITVFQTVTICVCPFRIRSKIPDLITIFQTVIVTIFTGLTVIVYSLIRTFLRSSNHIHYRKFCYLLCIHFRNCFRPQTVCQFFFGFFNSIFLQDFFHADDIRQFFIPVCIGSTKPVHSISFHF